MRRTFVARTINTILFDLGDTLLDFGRLDLQGLFNEGAALAYDYLQDIADGLPEFETYRRRHLRAIRLRAFWSMITGREFHSGALMGRLLQKMEMDIQPHELEELCWLWYEPLHRCANIEEGLVEMLMEFRDQGYRLGLVSNTFVPGEVLDRHIREEGFLHLLPMRVYSCDVGRRKPSKMIFRHALEQIQADPRETLFVGDSLKADIKGASRMGMRTVLKDPARKHANSYIRPTHRITSILELRKLLARYRGE
jgi:putative hydrolase of the HAD superfamily